MGPQNAELMVGNSKRSNGQSWASGRVIPVVPVVYVEVQSIEARNTRGLHGNYRDVVHATLAQLAGVYSVGQERHEGRHR